jgi:hypothetical protein
VNSVDYYDGFSVAAGALDPVLRRRRAAVVARAASPACFIVIATRRQPYSSQWWKGHLSYVWHREGRCGDLAGRPGVGRSSHRRDVGPPLERAATAVPTSLRPVSSHLLVSRARTARIAPHSAHIEQGQSRYGVAEDHGGGHDDVAWGEALDGGGGGRGMAAVARGARLSWSTSSTCFARPSTFSVAVLRSNREPGPPRRRSRARAARRALPVRRHGPLERRDRACSPARS